MISSMTGHGVAEGSDSQSHVRIEVKSVNNRFREMRFSGYKSISSEMVLRKEIEKKFSRGSFEIHISVANEEGIEGQLDEDKVLAYLQTVKKLAAKANVELVVRAGEFLRGEFLSRESDKEEKNILILKVFQDALMALEKGRIQEGERLKEILEKYQADYFVLLQKIEECKEGIKAKIEERLKKALEKSSIDIDKDRYYQEVIYYLEKYDIDEEVKRIGIHLKKFTQCLEEGKRVGRTLEFLLQELNRETNTIGSKVAHEEIGQHIVEMKSLLEKMREQSLNIE